MVPSVKENVFGTEQKFKVDCMLLYQAVSPMMDAKPVLLPPFWGHIHKLTYRLTGTYK